MTSNSKNELVISCVKELYEKRDKILKLPCEKVLEEIINAHDSAPLVHSIPEQDFYILINEIGPEDCLLILSLASNKQWEYILDNDVWEKDRIDIGCTTRWLDLLLKSDPQRMIKWAVTHKAKLIKFYLNFNVEVLIREHDQDPSDFGGDLFTLDDTFYIRFLNRPLEIEPADKNMPDINEETCRDFLIQFIQRLAEYDYIKYQQIIMESAYVLPAYVEEEEYRLRNVRLGEKGFLPFDEAISIYKPMMPTDMENNIFQPVKKTDELNLKNQVPLYPSNMIGRNNLFTKALEGISLDGQSDRIKQEFVVLANQIIIADQIKVKTKDDLSKIVKKVCGYLTVGLESLIKQDVGSFTNQSTTLLKNHPLIHIFRVGYGAAMTLKWEAKEWIDKCWFLEQGLSLSFWGEEGMGVLGGLLIKKPLFYNDYMEGNIYREFFEKKDITYTKGVLKSIIAIDDLLSITSIDLKSYSKKNFFTYKSILLTLWARDYLGLSAEPIPLELKQFKTFFKNIWTRVDGKREIRVSTKASFLKWLSKLTNLPSEEIISRCGEILENLFVEIKEEYCEVSNNDIDPRYIHLFSLK